MSENGSSHDQSLVPVHIDLLGFETDLVNLVDIIDATRYPRVYRGDPIPRAKLYTELDPFFSHESITKALDAHYKLYFAAYNDI